MGKIEVMRSLKQANVFGQAGSDPELAAQSLLCLMETTELFPSMIKIDLYGGVYSIYESKIPIPIALIHGRGLSSVKCIC
jgi:hypothetical protein